jgi:tryptophan synthase alpha chain
MAKEVTQAFGIPFLLMSYYNILFKQGVQHFVYTMGRSALRGAIIPDLPPEEGETYLKAMEEKCLAPILIFSPTTPQERMKYLNNFARGFIYCVSRKGVTGENTEFSETLDSYLSRCRRATSLPLAVGFGIKEKSDIDFLRGKADIAVIGTQTIRVMEERGTAAVGDFIRTLR